MLPPHRLCLSFVRLSWRRHLTPSRAAFDSQTWGYKNVCIANGSPIFLATLTCFLAQDGLSKVLKTHILNAQGHQTAKSKNGAAVSLWEMPSSFALWRDRNLFISASNLKCEMCNFLRAEPWKFSFALCFLMSEKRWLQITINRQPEYLFNKRILK